MAIPYTVNPQVIISEDGSSTLSLEGIEETYHSVHGAIAESLHIYINAGLKKLPLPQLSILEIGMGTGLNVLLTLIHAQNQNIHYTTLEPYPIREDIIAQLNYGQRLQAQTQFRQIHSQPWNQEFPLSSNFWLKKVLRKIEDFEVEPEAYDLVYFDAFCAQVNPELWEIDVLQKVSKGLRENGILVTYCAKGSFKRVLKQLNFQIESLPGPHGKREITRTIKK